MDTKFNIHNIRKDFPMLKKSMNGKPLIYLDTAATALKPKPVIDAIAKFYLEEYGTVHRAIYELGTMATDMYSNVRRKVKEFIHAKSEDEILFTKGTTDSINLVANAYGRPFLKEGDEVLISVMEHHSNIVPWQIICQEKGCKLKAIPINQKGELILEEFEKLLSPRTKIVSIAHISNVTGTVNPIKKMIRKAHENGSVVLIDGAQGISHLPINVQDLNADFYAFSGHKMYGPTGVGVLYGKRQLLEKMRPYQGGGDMIESVTIEASTYQPPPLRFEPGTPMIAEVIGLGKAIEYLESIGMHQIAAWEKLLLDKATQEFSEIEDVHIIGQAKEKSAILSFAIKNTHPLDVATLLDLKGIAVRTGHLCAQPTLNQFGYSSIIRTSFGLYNTLEEIDQVVQALKETMALVLNGIIKNPSAI